MPLDPNQKRKRGRPRLGQEPSTAVSLRLDQASLAKVREIARTQGIGPTMLLRRWVLEHLQASEQ
jgi:transposase-like protein